MCLKKLKKGILLSQIATLLFSISCASVKKVSVDKDNNNDTSHTINKVVILGNSIVFHSPTKSIGWNGNWGMAASSKQKDFVHLLERRITDIKPTVKFSAGTIVTSFERNYWNIDSNVFRKYIDQKPDLIILKIGENIDESTIGKNNFKKNLKDFILLLKKESDNSKVCIAGSFWPKEHVDSVLREVCMENGWIYVYLSDLYSDKTNTAMGQYNDKGVAMHPSDTGMRLISDRIWDHIKSLFLE